MSHRLKVVILVVDDRFSRTGIPPCFGSAPTALLEGFSKMSEDLETHIVACTPPMHAGNTTVMNSMTFHAIPIGKYGFIHTLHLGCRLSIGRLLKKLKPDLVHAMGTERWCAVSGALRGYPTLLSMHGILGRILPSSDLKSSAYWRLQEFLERMTIPRFDKVICNSRHTEAYVEKLTRRTELIPHGIRRLFLDSPPLPRDDVSIPVILCVGTFYVLKRQLEILHLARNLHARGARVIFRFLGDLGTDDEYSLSCRLEIAVGEAAGYVQYGGKIGAEDVLRELDTAHAMIHFSEEESFGLAVAEGLARGLKVFTNAAGGLRDVIDGVDGVILEEDVSRLGQLIEGWLEAGAPRLPDAALIMQQRYSPDKIATRHLELYHRLVRDKAQK